MQKRAPIMKIPMITWNPNELWCHRVNILADDERKRCILTHMSIRRNVYVLLCISDSSSRSVGVELESHILVDFVVRSNILHKTKTDRRDTSVDRKGIAQIISTRLAKCLRCDGRAHFGATLGTSPSTGNWCAHSRSIARKQGGK